MSTHPGNRIFKLQNKTLIPATFKKGIISSVNPTARTANVTFSENPNVTVKSVPLAAHIAIGTVVPGRNCRVDLFNETVSGQMCIAYIF
jgi:hypothetical protein